MRNPRKPLPRQSRKRRKEAAVYARRKKVFLWNNGYCFACGRWIHPSIRELHHFRGRAGSLYLDERFWKMADPWCHRQIHDNPKWAKAAGLLAGPGEWNKPVPLCGA